MPNDAAGVTALTRLTRAAAPDFAFDNKHLCFAQLPD
jgi:hypothetical protein